MTTYENYKIGDLFTPSAYADLKQVKAPRITALKEQLKTVEICNKWFIVNCESNDELFNNPSHLRASKK